MSLTPQHHDEPEPTWQEKRLISLATEGHSELLAAEGDTPQKPEVPKALAATDLGQMEEDRRTRRFTREKLERWSRACEEKDDDELVYTLANLLASVRNTGKELQAARDKHNEDQSDVLQRRLQDRMLELGIAAEELAERRGHNKRSRGELQSLEKQLRHDMTEFRKANRNKDPNDAELQRRIEVEFGKLQAELEAVRAAQRR